MAVNMAETESKRRTEMRYDPRALDAKWQGRWAEDNLYEVRDDDPRPKWYELTMYPYPSGDLHIGHWYAMSGADAHARFMRMRGYNVLHPMGFDAFGLNAENAAIERGIHPAKWTMGNIDKMRRQFRSMGAIYDWDRELVTCVPEYYRWNQWIFLQFLKSGLAYRDFAPANWCPTDNTVLANEQVVDGRCERCDSEVVRRELNQWLFRVTKYADELLDQSQDRLAREDQRHADQLDRPQRGRRHRVRHIRARPRSDDADYLHDAHRHDLRRDVRRVGPRAPAGGQADDAGAQGRGRGLRGPKRAARPRSNACRPRRSRRACSPAPTRSTD